MKNKSHPKVTFKWSSVDQVLLPRGNLPDSQNIHFDVAKIRTISEISKFSGIFFYLIARFNSKTLAFLKGILPLPAFDP